MVFRIIEGEAKVMQFTNRNSNNYQSIRSENISIKNLNEHQYLGLILDTRLTLGKHIDEKIISLADKGIGVIRRCINIFPGSH